MTIGHMRAACQDMRQPGHSAQSSLAACMSAKDVAGLKSMRHVFVADGVTASTRISATAHAKGTNATVSANDVHVSGTTLLSLIYAHSTNVKPGQIDITFLLSRIDGAWYVTGMNMNLG
ncbi:MAG: hypothetical protein ACRDN0_16875 [Trebonia sp.]